MDDIPTINRSVVLRLYPNKTQAEALRRWQGGLRFVWNRTLDWCLAERVRGGAWPREAAILGHVVAMKAKEETQWLRELPAHALLALGKDLHRAFRNWLEGRAARPKFRAKCQRQFSVYMVNQRTTIKGSEARLPKLGVVRFRCGTFPNGGRLLYSRIYQKAEKWYMSTCFECAKPKRTEAVISAVGIDMGLSRLATVFDGQRVFVVDSPKAMRSHKKRLARYHRRFSRRVEGSKRRALAKRRFASLQQRIANIRQNVSHQATSRIVALADTIVVESLNVSGMMRNRSLARTVADAGMSEFLRQIRYKAAWQGRTVIEASPWFPSTKTCSACGKVRDMPLGVRKMSCVCGLHMDRDENAARNLFAYREELGNVGKLMPESRVETGVHVRAATSWPVPVSETRMFEHGRAGSASCKTIP